MQFVDRFHGFSTLLLVGAIAAFGVGCTVQAPPKLRNPYRASVELQRQAQVANPEAPADYEPLEGLDGTSAMAGLEQYQKSFNPEESSPPPALFAVTESGN